MADFKELQAFLDKKIAVLNTEKDIIKEEVEQAVAPNLLDLDRMINDLNREYFGIILPRLEENAGNVYQFTNSNIDKALDQFVRLSAGFQEDAVEYIKFRLAQGKYAKNHNIEKSITDFF